MMANLQLSLGVVAVVLAALHGVAVAMPTQNTAETVVLVEEIVRLGAANAGESNATANASAAATLVTLSDASAEPVDENFKVGFDERFADTSKYRVIARTKLWTAVERAEPVATTSSSDDLIFPAKRPRNEPKSSEEQSRHRIDLSTSDEGDSSLTAHSDADSRGEEATDEIELPPDAAPAATKPIDMSDFLALIPAAEVQSIVANYYRHDAEVQRAYAFLSGRHFAEIREHIVQMPEIKAFLRYLNSSGLDVLAFLETVTNQTRKQVIIDSQQQQQQQLRPQELIEPTTANEIEKHFPSATTANPGEPTTAKEQLNGLHGLVDSILDVLPQDQILTTFFDKLESDEQFSKLVDSIGTPAFAKILSGMQNSVALRNLIFTLHNNGIYITRIVDSLKSYFFLGTL